ncbi:hypothetical protein [Amycolatopsis kentuckyensis]|uniref:hypothetical protein n=1 Tax=Amycolatopsis kentuckyensis TaxID=218823 RepID=UPI001FC978E2|nr:hypothetical protein [Amycolatopsis kentuckyensis]
MFKTSGIATRNSRRLCRLRNVAIVVFAATVAAVVIDALSHAIVAIMQPKLVPTGVAAQALGVDRATLVRWWQDGKVEPAVVTAGGHGRWDLADLHRQLKRQRR